MTDRTNASIPEPISAGLTRLRSKLTMWLVVNGVARLFMVLVALLIFDFVVDRTFHMDRPQRAVMLMLALGTIGFVVFRKIFLPLKSQPTDEALCLEVEARNPNSGQSLISAFQLSQAEDLEAKGYSLAMVRETIATGARTAADTQFEDVLRSRRHRANWMITGVMGTILFGAIASTFASESMAIWFNRNILLGNRQWPQDVILHISGSESGTLVIPRGDDWPVVVTVDESSVRRPHEVSLDLITSTGRERSVVLEKTGDAFATTLINVEDATSLRARSGRSSTKWIPIELLDRPEIAQLQLSVIPPPYTQQDEEELPAGFGPYYVLPGSQLRIRGEANKALSEVYVTASGWREPMTIEEDALFSGQLSAEQVTDAVYSVHLTDTHQVYLPYEDSTGPLTSRTPTRFTLRLKPDREPQVRASLNGVSTMVVPQAIAPVTCRATDDFHITNMRLQHKVLDPEGEESPEQSQSLASLVKLPASLASFEHAFELEPLELPIGATLQFWIEAEDNNDVTGPGVGKSKTFLLRIVSEQELRADLLRREKELRQDFKRLLDAQSEMLTDTQAIAAATRGEATFQAEHLEILIKIVKRQKLVGTNLGNVARRFEDIAIEVGNNQIEEANGPLQSRLKEKIVGPSWLLADDSIPDLVDDFDEARRIKNLGDRNQKMTNLIRDQEQVIDDMEEILRHMEESEGFQAAVNMLYEVQKAQQDVLKMTDKEREEIINRILNQNN